MAVMNPTGKRIGRGIRQIRVAFSGEGWPRWTHLNFDDATTSFGLDEEEVRDLHYALGRIVAYLDSAK